MLGAATGDIIGSCFEFDNYKDTDFELFSPTSDYTDDTICTAAVAEWVLGGCEQDLAIIMQTWCRRYPNPCGAYGARFNQWIWSSDPQPYKSWGNGSAMRVSAIGWAFDSLDETLDKAEQSAAITHNHPEGIKGALATAAAIFWARQGENKDYIRQEIESEFGYDLSQTCEQIRPEYRFYESCQGTVPQAIIAFLDSHSFEHAIRLAISLGGDSDTIAAITGSVAEAYYGGIPAAIRKNVLHILPHEISDILLKITQ
ncbi:ADP-ribosylglycohydrolase family protein [Wielerella bovis]|uniref:ADP-ribosylglycohydrolase family protein n=1 Tax=Wielerella bovis TaxID=2917790 RepID=UPI00201A0CF9|nr:ADP-ribosylglycohydrolase family protein [Wielerella bovis]MCG7657219.1 ADP-ribosylglycohydrolase family protein [Wielerella bovis]MCG7659441.1 ADP-ribosylglycohydrolase family protein [Wielerella bovis]